MDVVGKNSNMLQHHSDWTSIQRKEEEMPGTLQSLTLIFLSI
jgi:hypothetical protein